MTLPFNHPISDLYQVIWYTAISKLSRLLPVKVSGVLGTFLLIFHMHVVGPSRDAGICRS